MADKCDQWSQGYCRVLCLHRELIRCPAARAENAPPGTCCHHPLNRVDLVLVDPPTRPAPSLHQAMSEGF